MAALTNSSRTLPLAPCSLSLVDIRSILNVLERKNQEAAELQVAQLLANQTLPKDEMTDLCEQVRAAHMVTITIETKKNKRFHGHGSEYLSTPGLPEDIISIYADSSTFFSIKANGAKPDNWFSLLFDFSKPLLLDWANPLYAPTPNNSRLYVEGANEDWQASVLQITEEKISSRKNNRGFLHRAFVYDMLLTLMGIPLTFWLLAILGPTIDPFFASRPSIVTNAFYFYVFFLSVWIFRIWFGYTKWAWPKIELLGAGNNSIRHRAFWGAIVFALLSSAIAKTLFG